VTFTIDALQAGTDVTVRRPLAQQLSFTPGWEQDRVPAGTELRFGVQHSGNRHINCTWQVSGQAGSMRGAQFQWQRRPAINDTVRVLVHDPGGAFGPDEKVVLTWFLTSNRPPQLTAPARTELVPGQVFAQTIGVSDADGDAVALTLDHGPAGLRLDPRHRVLQWTPTPGQLGSWAAMTSGCAPMTARQWSLSTSLMHVMATGRAAPTSNCRGQLAAAANPFHSSVTLRLCGAPLARRPSRFSICVGDGFAG